MTILAAFSSEKTTQLSEQVPDDIISTSFSSSGGPRSDSSLSEEENMSDSPSPSAICFQRKLSAAVVTSEKTEHDLLEGRPKLLYSQSTVRTNSAVQKTNENATTAQALHHPPIVKRSFTVPLDQRLADFCIHPAPLSVEHWSDPPAMNFKVRGSGYLKDRVKTCSKASVFKLLTVDLIKVQQPIYTGMCAHPKERIQLALRREEETGIRELPDFIFCVNYVVPGDPYFHWVAYFGIDDVSILRDPTTPLGRLAEPFFFGNSDEFRDNTFKLIPRIVEGNFVVRKAVGSKPTILGRKLKQHYIQSDRYFELIVDIGSDAVADRIVKLSLGYAKTLCVDMMFLLEGTREDQLPEQILAGARMERLDFKKKDLQRVLK